MVLKHHSKHVQSAAVDHQMIGLGVVSFVAVMAMAVLVFVGSSQQLTGHAVQSLTDGELLLHYTGKEVGAIDKSGHGNDGQLMEVLQKDGYFKFSGTTNSYIVRPKFTLGDSGITAMFRAKSLAPERSASFVSYSVGSAQAGAASDELLIWYDHAVNSRAIVVVVRGVKVTFPQKSNPFASATPRHVTVTYRKDTGEVALYFDGVKQGSRTGVSRNKGFRPQGALVFGQDLDCMYPKNCQPFGQRAFNKYTPGGFHVDQSLQGEMSDIRIYRRALTASEVAVVVGKK